MMLLILCNSDLFLVKKTPPLVPPDRLFFGFTYPYLIHLIIFSIGLSKKRKGWASPSFVHFWKIYIEEFIYMENYNRRLDYFGKSSHCSLWKCFREKNSWIKKDIEFSWYTHPELETQLCKVLQCWYVSQKKWDKARKISLLKIFEKSYLEEYYWSKWYADKKWSWAATFR